MIEVDAEMLMQVMRQELSDLHMRLAIVAAQNAELRRRAEAAEAAAAQANPGPA